MLTEKPEINTLEAEDEKEKWYKKSPFFEALIGIVIITLAAIAELVHVWISFPGSILTIQDFCHELVECYAYVFQFDLKLWWVFLLMIYLSTRKNVK